MVRDLQSAMRHAKLRHCYGGGGVVSGANKFGSSLISMVLVSAVAGGIATSALAQDRKITEPGSSGLASKSQEKKLRPPEEVTAEKNVDAADKAYQPKGVDLGQFLLLPKIELDETYNDNVFAKAYDTKADFITTVRPEVAVRSRFDNHELNFLGRIEHKEFAKYTGDTVTEFFGQSDGRLDVTKTNSLRGLVSYQAGHEDRGSPDDVGGVEPTPFRYLTARGGGVAGLGRLTSSLDFGMVDRSFDDVRTATGVSPNRLRDRVDYEETLREAYEVIPGYFAVVEGALNQRVYANSADVAGYNRDSNGWRINSGLGVDISQVIRGDFLVGYFQQDYSDDRLTDPRGLSIKSMLNWSPTRMTQVVPSLERSVEETTATGVAALVRTSGSVLVRHELQRNIIVSSVLSYSHDTQQGGKQETDTYDGRFSGTYLLNANVYVGVEVDLKRKLSNVDAAGFDQHTVMARLGLQY